MNSPAERAAARVAFQLTYARTDTPRRFTPGELTGPDLDDAFEPGGKAPGDWQDGDDLGEVFADRTEDEWIDRFANYAINEAIHEALEWYRVDGKPWLNPHGKAENRIYALTNRLVEDLAELRRTALAEQQRLAPEQTYIRRSTA